MIRYFLFVFLLIANSHLAAQETNATVCQLLMRASNRDFVLAEGLINGSTQHGFFLSEEGTLEPCRNSSSALRTTPGAATLVFIDYAGVSLTSQEHQEIDTFRRELDTQVAKREFKPFRIQVTGTLLVDRDARITRMPSGFLAGNAFGQDGKFRLLLVVKSVKRLD